MVDGWGNAGRPAPNRTASPTSVRRGRAGGLGIGVGAGAAPWPGAPGRCRPPNGVRRRTTAARFGSTDGSNPAVTTVSYSPISGSSTTSVSPPAGLRPAVGCSRVSRLFAGAEARRPRIRPPGFRAYGPIAAPRAFGPRAGGRIRRQAGGLGALLVLV